MYHKLNKDVREELKIIDVSTAIIKCCQK